VSYFTINSKPFDVYQRGSHGRGLAFPLEVAMANSNKILVINGSYRDDGITDQAIAAAFVQLQERGADQLWIGYGSVQAFHGAPRRLCLLAMGQTLFPLPQGRVAT
jgi:hypothetical protein